MFFHKGLGVVEAMIRGRRGTGILPERGTGTTMQMEKKDGTLIKKPLVVPRMRRMTMVGPLSAAE